MKYTRRFKNRRNYTYRRKPRGGTRYIVPKKNQYEIKGDKYFKLILEPETKVGEIPRVTTLRDLTLDKASLRNQSIDTLKAIVKNIIQEEPLKKKTDIIQQILDNMELE